ncbi:MAG: hypothetical protein LBF22_12565 [Deltaproteobacteria bacterium]|jgi:TPR repeat protein|nr:hypothetical protein [Deltaproteobacteria bacterium]
MALDFFSEEQNLEPQVLKETFAKTQKKLLPQAKLGNKLAQYRLGELLFDSKNPFRDLQMSRSWFLKAAKQGCGEAYYYLGKIAKLKNCKKWSYYLKASLNYFLQGAQKFDIRNFYELTNIYLSGYGTKRDYKKACAYALQASETHDSRAYWPCARLILLGYGENKTLRDAIPLLEKVKGEGLKEARLLLAYFAYEKERTLKNEKEYLQLLKELAPNNNPYLYLILSEIHRTSLYPEIRNPKISLSYLKAAVKKNYLKAHTAMGKYFLEIDAPLKNNQKAFSFLEKAAAAGEPEAMLEIAKLLFAKLVKVPKPEKQGIHWLKQAAQSGSLEASFNLALRYLDGQEVKKSQRFFLKWLKKAAQGYYLPAILLFAKTLHQTENTLSDEKAAICWYQIAAQNGSQEAMIALSKMFGESHLRDQSLSEYWARQAEVPLEPPYLGDFLASPLKNLIVF